MDVVLRFDVFVDGAIVRLTSSRLRGVSARERLSLLRSVTDSGRTSAAHSSTPGLSSSTQEPLWPFHRSGGNGEVEPAGWSCRSPGPAGGCKLAHLLNKTTTAIAWLFVVDDTSQTVAARIKFVDLAPRP
jgi:hypothetical protein